MRIATSLFLLFFSLPLTAKPFAVTNTEDSGPGSLRQAMADASGYPCRYEDRCEIVFSIEGPVPASGWFTIAPLSPLPVLQQGWTTFDGATQTAFTGDTNPFGPEIELDGSRAGYRSGLKFVLGYGWKINALCVNRFQGHGIFLDGSGGATISDNYVGVDPTGRAALPNGFDGIALRDVGGTGLTRNVVSGNRGNGIYVNLAYDVFVENNRVGVAASGVDPIPNGASGIDVRGRANVHGNIVGHNVLYGIATLGDVSVGTNEVFENGLLAFTTWNLPHPFGTEPPVLLSAIEDSTGGGYYTGFPEVTGRVHAAPDTEVFVNVYVVPYAASDPSQSQTFIGSATVRTDAIGDATFVVRRHYSSSIPDLYGGYVVANAKAQHRQLSAYSALLPLTITTPTFEVTTTADSGRGSLRNAVEQASEASCRDSAPCRITFNVANGALTDGAARIVLHSTLPPIRGYVRFLGDAQRWWHGDTNPDGPEVEIRGGQGLQFGTAAAPAPRVYVNSVVINGSGADGLTVVISRAAAPEPLPSRVIIRDVYSGTDVHGTKAVPNAGNGLRIHGGASLRTFFWTNASVTNCVFAGNRLNGVLLDGEVHTLRENLIGLDTSKLHPLPNGGHGVYVTAGIGHVLEDNVIAYNTRAGVATAKGVRAPSVLSSVYRNGSLGIDVNEDGVSPNDGNFEDGTIDPPTIDRARYDAAANVTYFEGRDRFDVYPLTPTFGLVGDVYGHGFFFSDEPDPSGRGEAQTRIGSPYALKSIEGTNGAFRIGVSGDLRGKWITATTNRYNCYYEFGCTSKESSEFSVAVKVE